MSFKKKKLGETNNILLIGFTSMGDRISQIPFLLKMKAEGKKVYLFEYEKGYVNYTHNLSDIYSLLKSNDLYEDIILIPFNKKNLFVFMIKLLFTNFQIFKNSYSPAYTLIQRIRGFLFSKKWTYSFKDNNDISKFNNIVAGTINQDIESFYKFKKYLTIPYSREYKKVIGDGDYVTVYVGPFTGSLKVNERKKIFDFLIDKGLKIVFIGSDLNSREGWISDYTKDGNGFVNLLGKTNFEQLCSIITDAKFTISANGGLMWLSHLLNEKSISFSVMSGYILHPPIDNKNSFHLCLGSCKLPCEWRVSELEYKKYGMKKCVYRRTKREGCCRNIKGEKIISIINNFVN